MKVIFSREFKWWDGQKANTYPPGENDVPERCAQCAKDAGVVEKPKKGKK